MENDRQAGPDSRPPTSHRVALDQHDDADTSRESFGDDGHSLTPAAPTETSSTTNHSNKTNTTDTTNPTNHVPTPTLKAENIPPLHPPSAVPLPASVPDSSFFEGPSIDYRHSDSQAEIAVREHLQDIESSFSAPLSPIPASNNGIDDTYQFDSPSKKPVPVPAPVPAPRQPSQPSHQHADDATEESQLLPDLSSESGPRPGQASSSQDADESRLLDQQEYGDESSFAKEVGNGTSMLEAFSSSPTAAAVAARTISRAASSLTNNGLNTSTRTDHHAADNERLAPVPDNQNIQAAEDSSQPPESEQGQSVAGALRNMSSDQSLRQLSADTGITPNQGLKLAKQRPKFLRSKNASQRSSVSSLLTDPESDVTVGIGTDYALQSGGAVPALAPQPRFSNALSRSVSMGSMASGIEDLHEAAGPYLETLDEVDTTLSPTRTRSQDQDQDVLQTPRAKRTPASLAAPTDTVIARHVRDVHVPESLAREYRTKSGLVTPRKTTDFAAAIGLGASTATSTTSGRQGTKSLTLKEQSSTIERLSKENFDLKLKVMFLSDRLDKLSEEGIKEMISENVELKTGLAVLQRDNKMLRRRVKELEKQLKDDDARPGTARSGQSDEDQSPGFDHEAIQERDEEIVYLREQIEEYMTEIERLRNDNLTKEAEKRRMADVVRTLGEKAGERVAGDLGRQEEADVWKDLLEQETARREQGDEDNRRLRDEVFRLKQELSGQHAGSVGGGALHHTTNIYHITKRREHGASVVSGMSPTRSAAISSYPGDMDGVGGHGGSMSGATASTLIDELKRESEQLRHENAELRREVGAQTSMLTSRNREKERLYQEIEDLKMAQRRGAPAPSTIDSILERSASRAGAHERSQSRASGGTRLTGAATTLDEADREEFENKMADLRDKNNELKLQNQDLQRELDACMEDFETAVGAKKQAEELVAALQEDLETAMNDLMALQAERDEALQEHANLESEFDALRKEAQDELDALEAEADQRSAEMEKLQLDLAERTESFEALQDEMRKMSEGLVRLEDEQEAKLRRIQQLEAELGDANKELEELEAKLFEANDKANRLSVQQESSQGEIAFLREEQEGDKIRIGDLEAALAGAEQSLRDERERARELEQRLATERRQREIVANREKEEVQQFVNELNKEASAAKDEARRLRKNLTSREVEATEWKERLIELENNLREALGDLNGTRSSLLKSIAKLQRDLENTVRDLDATKASLVDKDRIIKQRDALLESHALESRKLSEMLDKERQAHRNVKHQFETFQRTHQHVTRTVSTQDLRIGELEAAKAQDKKRMAQLEATLREQLTERNNLLLVLWTRLSALCGSDWAHDNSLINGRALPSLEAVATMLPGFSKNLLAAVKTIETMVGSFQGKIKSVERDLWREYQTLESHLEMRTKKLDRLEAIVRNNITNVTFGGSGSPSMGSSVHMSSEAQARLARLEEAYRQLKVENHTLRTAAEVRQRAAYAAAASGSDGMDGSGSPSPSVPTGPIAKDRSGRAPSKSGRSSTRAPSQGAIPVRSTGSNYSMRGAAAGPRGSLAPEELGMVSSRSPTLATAEDGEHDEKRQQQASNAASQPPPPGSSSGASGGVMDNKWMLRLRDLEYKLKAEREARMLDRGEALKRINASESENVALREGLEREKRRQGR